MPRPLDKIVFLLLVAGLFPLLPGCPPSSPSSSSSAPTVNVKVKDTDCDMKDLKLTATVQQDNSGGALHLNINVDVTCKGVPLSGATLIITIPGSTTKTELKSDSNGNASGTAANPGNKDLIGQTVGVAAVAEDGKAVPQPPAVTITKAP